MKVDQSRGCPLKVPRFGFGGLSRLDDRYAGNGGGSATKPRLPIQESGEYGAAAGAESVFGGNACALVGA